MCNPANRLCEHAHQRFYDNWRKRDGRLPKWRAKTLLKSYSSQNPQASAIAAAMNLDEQQLQTIAWVKKHGCITNSNYPHKSYLRPNRREGKP